ncbi:MAG TPA: translation initiation factor IF-3 [Candidatus Hydrothermia bacterium]|nr:translation initiation factor IF-3 [Candidatus Hydrothermia bacterium]MDD5573150.1 translation initiation factor IF-3 [Candidatus Hydrothermia bacterium]HOK22724.1 translation initiation factor IF-3 [Candidatus Hydrothermia bacterium]HOL23433.1 translation initiation factor IF-3 [Candidatus Hydrothermia bacterium]HPO78383.1 translation initiation factor IF-3 [Candidatus Hydrothermia bacterium]
MKDSQPLLGPNFKKRNKEEPYRVNERIRAYEVRVIGPDGKHLGIVKTKEAIKIAHEIGLDLVEVDPNANPPVCKILDYGKLKYEEQKKQKEAKKKQLGEVREITMGPRILDHDLEVKLKKAREFLELGNKVRIKIMFRGREMAHLEWGDELFKKITARLEDSAQVEVPPKMEGRNLTFLLKSNK